MTEKTPKRPKARQAAAAAESGKRVKLLKDPSQMSPEDRVRYFLGLPQGYPVNPEHWHKIQSRLAARWMARDPSTERDDAQVRRLRDAPLPQLEKALHRAGMWKPAELAAEPVATHGQRPQEAYLTPFEMLLLEDTMGGDLPGARGRGESVPQARARARQEAAGPQNPRMGGPKRKHGTY